MSAELHVGDAGDNTIAPADEVVNRKNKHPGRCIAILIALAIIAFWLMVLHRPALYYPHIVIEAADVMQFDFLLDGRQDKDSCKRVAASIANAVTASCRECRTRSQTCIKNPSEELRGRFDETPLPVPSARMASGIITYSAPQAEAALLACRESERQAALNGDEAKVICYPAGAIRSHTAFENHTDETGHNTFTALLTIVGGLIASLIAAIVIAYMHRRRHLFTQAINISGVCIEPSFPLLQKFTLACVDALILLGTFLVLAWPADGDINRWSRLDRATVVGQALIIAVTIGWFWFLLEHYARRRPFWDELREIFRVLTVMFMVSGAAAFVAGLEAGRSSHLIVWALNFLLIPLGRAGVRQLLDDFGLWQRPAVIIGTGENARDAYLAIKSERGMGYRVLGFVSVGAGNAHQEDPAVEAANDKTLTVGTETFPVLNVSHSIESLIADLGNPQIILALDSLADQSHQSFVQRLVATQKNIHIIPSIRGLPLFGTELSHFFSHDVLFLTVRNNLSRRGYIWIKRIFDLVAASLLMILLLPLFLLLSYVIRRDGGNAIFGHVRVGQNGKPFKCLKFRSMPSDADKLLDELLENDPIARVEWEKNFKLKNDPRISRVGCFLRNNSLDELPQLINVIRGEMSLVGPRPIVEAELARYHERVGFYLQVRPGITGLWQISGRNDVAYAKRVTLDAWYVQNWSLWYDIVILIKTVDVVFNRRGAY